MEKLTDKQKSILDFIRGFIEDNGYAPVAKEINLHFGYSSLNASTQHLNAIERKGYIKRTPNISRSIVVLQE